MDYPSARNLPPFSKFCTFSPTHHEKGDPDGCTAGAHAGLFRRHRAGAEGVTISRAAKYWLLAGCAAITGLAVFTPAWIIQPFRPQTERGVEIALTLRRISPLLTIGLLLAIAALAFTLWRGARWWSRTVLVVALLITGACTWLARQNHFEWMFNPLLKPQYAGATAATFVDAADLVLAVERNGEAAAYPVRQLAYHHLVHDTVGRVPIVVTY